MLYDATIPAESPAVKEYFSRSPYAVIELLKNGTFQVVNMVNGCEFHQANTWADATAIRAELVNHYKNLG